MITFEKEAKEYATDCEKEYFTSYGACLQTFQDAAAFGYNKGKEEQAEKVEEAIEIIEFMKDLFFDCWQERGLKSINFEKKVNDFLKEVSE